MDIKFCGRFRVCGIFIQVREDNLGIYFQFKDILVGGMGDVKKYFVDFKKRINKFYSLIKKLRCQSHLCRKWGADQ